MRVVVDYDLCESNAVCMGILPEVFEVRDDDFLYVLKRESARGVPRATVAGCRLLSHAGHLARRGLRLVRSVTASLAG